MYSSLDGTVSKFYELRFIIDYDPSQGGQSNFQGGEMPPLPPPPKKTLLWDNVFYLWINCCRAPATCLQNKICCFVFNYYTLQCCLNVSSNQAAV